jgi:hypothetical protein
MHLKALVERIVTRKEVIEVWQGLADLRKYNIALFITGLKDIVYRVKVEGPAGHTMAYKRTKSMWGS